MPAILPVDLALIEKLEVRLVHDRCDLEPVVAPFTTQLSQRERAQLAMDERHEAIERLAAPALPFAQELGDVRRIDGLWHA
jgi:hypothetical protein